MDPSHALLDHLGPFPIPLADGISILAANAAGSLVLNVFGRQISLSNMATATDDEGAEIVFEGPIVESIARIGDLCVLSWPQVRIRVHRPAQDQDAARPLQFEVTGRGRLTLHGPLSFGANTRVLEGELRLIDSVGTGQRYLRLDFDESVATLPIAGGVVVSILPRRLLFSVDEDGSARLEKRVTCTMQGFPHPLREIFEGETFDADMTFTKDGATIEASTVREGFRISLPKLEAFGGNPAWNLDEMTLSAKHLRIEIGPDVLCRVELQIGVPAPLHTVMHAHVDVLLTACANDVRMQFLSSPFQALVCTRDPRGALQAHLHLPDNGDISFVVPEFLFDWANRCLVAEGRLAHENLRIPLAPVRALLDQAGMHTLAQRLPEAIPLQSSGSTGGATTLSNVVTQAFHAGGLADKSREVLNKLLPQIERMPKRLREVFLEVDVPKELAFRIECTFDFDARIHVAPSNDKAKAEASPVRLLVPFVGHPGPELLGLTMYRFAVGALRAGQALTVEIDAEVDRFEPLPIAPASTFLEEKLGDLTSADELHSRLVLRDVVALVGTAGGIPWLVPLCFRTMGLTYAGIDGLDLGIHVGFSGPRVNMGTLIRFLVHHHDALMQKSKAFEWPADMRLEWTFGPAYLRFPKVLGGQVLGSTHDKVSMVMPAQVTPLISAVQTLDKHRLLESIPAEYGARDIEVDFDPTFRHTMQTWATAVDPIRVVSATADRHEREPEKALASKFRGVTSGLARGLATLREEKTITRVRVYFKRVTPKGIELRVIGPAVMKGQAQERHVELHWHDIWGSAGRMGQVLGGKV